MMDVLYLYYKRWRRAEYVSCIMIWHDDVYDCNDDGFSGAIMMLGKECYTGTYIPSEIELNV